MLVIEGGRAQVLIEAHDGGRPRGWTDYLDEAERNRGAQASIGVVPTSAQNHGQTIRVIGPRRIVIAIAEDHDSTELLRSVCILLRSQALASIRTESSDGLVHGQGAPRGGAGATAEDRGDPQERRDDPHVSQQHRLGERQPPHGPQPPAHPGPDRPVRDRCRRRRTLRRARHERRGVDRLGAAQGQRPAAPSPDTVPNEITTPGDAPAKAAPHRLHGDRVRRFWRLRCQVSGAASALSVGTTTSAERLTGTSISSPPRPQQLIMHPQSRTTRHPCPERSRNTVPLSRVPNPPFGCQRSVQVINAKTPSSEGQGRSPCSPRAPRKQVRHSRRSDAGFLRADRSMSVHWAILCPPASEVPVLPGVVRRSRRVGVVEDGGP